MPTPSIASLSSLLEHLESFLHFQQELGTDSVEISQEHLAAFRATPSAAPAPVRLAQESTRAAPQSRAAPAPAPNPGRSGSSAEQLDAIADELRQSTFCPLKETAEKTVPGEGNPNPDIVFIGEAPGQEEDQQGRPFVGPSGEILTRVISAMGLSRDEVWIGNVVKWRPPNNRPPTPEEIAGCMPYLLRQLDILKPKVIVTLGGVATKAMLDTTEGISRLRGQWKEFQGTPVMPTFHPSFLLRTQNRQQKERYWEVWSDMESVLLKLGMPSPGKKK